MKSDTFSHLCARSSIGFFKIRTVGSQWDQRINVERETEPLRAGDMEKRGTKKQVADTEAEQSEFSGVCDRCRV